jgi:hypothetical protein
MPMGAREVADTRACTALPSRLRAAVVQGVEDVEGEEEDGGEGEEEEAGEEEEEEGEEGGGDVRGMEQDWAEREAEKSWERGVPCTR